MRVMGVQKYGAVSIILGAHSPTTQRTSTYGCFDATCSLWCTTTTWSEDPQISRQFNTWDMMKRELNSSPEPATTIAELRQQVQDAWVSLSQDDMFRKNCFSLVGQCYLQHAMASIAYIASMCQPSVLNTEQQNGTYKL